MARRLLDTNVPVYTDDGGDRRRARLALAAVQEAIESREVFATLEVVQVDVGLILGAVDLHRLHTRSRSGTR